MTKYASGPDSSLTLAPASHFPLLESWTKTLSPGAKRWGRRRREAASSHSNLAFSRAAAPFSMSTASSRAAVSTGSSVEALLPNMRSKGL